MKVFPFKYTRYAGWSELDLILSKMDDFTTLNKKPASLARGLQGKIN